MRSRVASEARPEPGGRRALAGRGQGVGVGARALPRWASQFDDRDATGVRKLLRTVVDLRLHGGHTTGSRNVPALLVHCAGTFRQWELTMNRDHLTRRLGLGSVVAFGLAYMAPSLVMILF